MYMQTSEFESRYPFALDDYQRVAIAHLAEGDSVLVSAPTGSGKTVVAEYALEEVIEKGRRFFYTTPLKALSNQKYRDLLRTYGQDMVGLLTGDNSINGDAPLVVMTTEVLRNMIYEESPLLEDLEAVVLDEVHYMQDPFRGAVWEEIVIMLPAPVRLVALSATVSNAEDLGDWMDRLRGGVKVVLSTERPVALKNYYFYGRSIVPLFSGNLSEKIARERRARKSAERDGDRGRGRGGKGSGLRPGRVDVIRALESKEMLPAIYFIFSRAGCDDAARTWLARGSKLTTAVESERIAAYLEEKVSPLQDADLECLDYRVFRDALMRGVAAHHAGVLPLFKEAVEELFAAGLVKLVFATETLSLGINMPARTVVIESLYKFGGERHRPLTAGEYKQLTGRAGRRGIDDVGYAVVLYQKYFAPGQVRSLVKREPTPVVSSFELSYNMAVNILSRHDLKQAEKILDRSFAQYVSNRRVVTLETRRDFLEQEIEKESGLSVCEEGDASGYRELERELSRTSRRLSSIRKDRRKREVNAALEGMSPGDVFLSGDRGTEPYALVKKRKGRKGRDMIAVDTSGSYRKLNRDSFKLPPVAIGAVDLNRIRSPKKKVRRSVGAAMEKLARKAGPPGEEKPGKGEVLQQREMAGVRKDRDSHPCHRCEHRQRCLEAARRLEKARKRLKKTEKEVRGFTGVVSRKLEKVVELLRKEGFLEGESVTAKGQLLQRVYNECDLALVEALDRGIVSHLEPRELVAFASWFIYESREGESEGERVLSRKEREHLEGALGEAMERLDEIQSRLKEGEAELGLDLLGSIDTGFSEAAYDWASGAELEQMMVRDPGRPVGDMVRIMKQIIDLLRQLADVTPDPVLASRLGEAMDLVDRGVVGYSSLESIIEHGGEYPEGPPPPGRAGAEADL